MSLVFGANTSDRVTIAPHASINDLTLFSAWGWFYVTTITSQRTIISKYRGTSSEGWAVFLQGTSGAVRFEHARATSFMVYTSSTTPATANKWVFVLVTEDQAASPPAHIYTGDTNTPATEVSYTGPSTAGSGAFAADNARSLMLGNRDLATPNLALQGRIAGAGVIARIPTLAEIRSIQFEPSPLVPDTRAFYDVGRAGSGTTAETDLSGNGNTGTPTGTTIGEHVPIPSRRLTSPFAALERAGSW